MADVAQHDVFISYSRRDIAFARILHDALNAENLGTWIDWQDIPPSADWLVEVYRAIESTNTFVFIVSNTSAGSEICHLEIAHAIKHNKRLVPIVLHDVDPKKLPQHIASLNWIFFREQDDFQHAFDQLHQAIETDLEWVRAHTRLLQRSIEWENRHRDTSFLLRGSDLNDVLQWLTQVGAGKEPALTSLQAAYVQESQKWEAEQERRWKRRTHIIWSLIGAALVIAVTLTTWALHSANEAREQQKTARANELAAYARMTFDEDPTLSFQLARAALEIKPTVMAKNALWAPLQYPFTTLLLEGHMSGLRHVQFSPDGMLIATAAWDGTARIWDVVTGEQLHLLIGHAVNFIETAEFSPDGNYLVTTVGGGTAGGADRTARVWDVATGEELHVLDRYQFASSPAFSPDSKLIAYLPSRGWKPVEYDVPILDIKTGRHAKVLKGHTDTVTVAEFSPDGRFIVTAAKDQTVRIWDAATGDLLKTFIQQASPRDARFSPCGNYVVTSFSNDQATRVWDAVTGEKLIDLQDEGLETWYARFSPDGKKIITTMYSSATSLREGVIVWDASTGEQLFRLTEGEEKFSFSPDGMLLATAGPGNQSRVYDSATGELLFSIRGHIGEVYSVCFSPDGKYLLTGSGDLTARVWQLAAGQELYVLETPEPHLTDLTDSPNYTKIADWIDVARITEVTYDPGTVNAVLSPDGSRIFTSRNTKIRLKVNGKLNTADCSGTGWIWDTETDQVLQALEGDMVRIVAAAFSPDGNYLVASQGYTEDNMVRLWDVSTGRIVHLLQGHDHSVMSTGFSPDGKLIITSSRDGTVRIWDIATGRQVRLWDVITGQQAQVSHQGLLGEVLHAAFSPDGLLIVTRSYNDLVKVWDYETGRELYVLQEDELTTGYPHFSPDGKKIITSDIGGITVWDASTGEKLFHLPDSGWGDFSPDGKQIVTRENERYSTICFRELETGNQVYEIDSIHTIRGLRFSPDGTKIVASCGDGTVRIWDIDSGRSLYIMKGLTGSVQWADFLPCGKRIITLSDDGRVRIWPANYEEMLRLVDEGFRDEPRELTEQEKIVYGFVPWESGTD